MSLLLSQPELDAARQAHAHGELTPAAYAFLRRLIVAVEASRSLAPSASVSGTWDEEGIEETRQAWLEESLLRGALQRAFDRCATPRALSRYLERALRNWLISRARAARGQRLLERARRLLAARIDMFELFVDAPEPADRWWGLRGWHDPALWQDSVDLLLAHAWSLGDFSILRFGSQASNRDPVLSTPDLVRFMSGLLERAHALLSLALIEAVLRRRFALDGPGSSERLDAAEALPDPDDVESRALVREAALHAIGALSGRQVAVLRDRPGQTLEALAAQLGCSRGTVDNEYRRAVMTVRDVAPSDELVGDVLEIVAEIASWGEVSR